MGQNCVAGTTEFDEQEGIGLVLYVNSESNLIVWNMSNGTKQENVVPLTTEYRSMLKSEFENKTGVTIGYIIIHRYTEETIDIGSSIKINSGDTPGIENGFKYELYGSYIVGTCRKENSNFLDAYLLKSAQTDMDRAAMFHSLGYYTGGGAYLETDVQQNLLSALESHFGEKVEHIYYELCPVSQGEILPNWDEYEIVS